MKTTKVQELANFLKHRAQMIHLGNNLILESNSQYGCTLESSGGLNTEALSVSSPEILIDCGLGDSLGVGIFKALRGVSNAN